MIRRLVVATTLITGLLTGCALFEREQVITFESKQASAQSANGQLVEVVRFGKVVVDWQHADILKQPQLEAKRLSDIIYRQSDAESLIDETSENQLHVIIIEAFLRPDGRGRNSSNYLAGSVELLDQNGEYQQRFRIKANYTQNGGDPIGIEDRLDELYAKFSDLTVHELNHIQTIDSSVAENTTL